MIPKNLLAEVLSIDGIVSVTGDAIPGPPPNHIPVIIINAVATDDVSSLAAPARLERYREIASDIVRLLKNAIADDYNGTISIRVFNSRNRCRNYCLNATVKEVHGLLQSAFRGHESSQDITIENVLKLNK